LDNIKSQMTSPSTKKPGIPGAGNAMLVNIIVASLRPHVPEYTNVVMAQLAKSETQKSFKDSIRGVLANAVKETFSSTDMTAYSRILKAYGCAETGGGAVCEERLATQIEEMDRKLSRDYVTVLASAALGFLLLMVGRPTL